MTFNYKPQNYNVWPARPFDPFDSPDGRHTLKFANIAPKEFLQIEMITNQPLPLIVSFRSKEGVGKLIQMRPYQVLRNYILALLWVFIFIGVATTVYVILVLIAPYIPYLRKD